MIVRSAELTKALSVEIEELNTKIQDTRQALAPLEDLLRVMQDRISNLCVLRNTLEMSAKGLEESV